MATITLNNIRKLVGFPELHWQKLCLPLLEMSDEHLKLLRKIMVVRQSFYLPPGAAAEDIYKDRDLWTYATLIIAVKKMGYTPNIPDIADAWLHNDLCQQHMAFAMSQPATGVFHEIVSHVLNDTETTLALTNNDETIDAKNVQSEQKTKNITSSGQSQSLGEMFIKWLKEELNHGDIIMSQRGSIVHAVEDGMIISFNAFKTFNKDCTDDVHQDFLKLDIFQTAPTKNKWDAGRGIFISGYLIKYEVFSDLKCDISINYELELCE